MHFYWDMILHFSLLSPSVFATISLPLSLKKKKKNQAMDFKNNNKGVRNKSSCGVTGGRDKLSNVTATLGVPRRSER